MSTAVHGVQRKVAGTKVDGQSFLHLPADSTKVAVIDFQHVFAWVMSKLHAAADKAVKTKFHSGKEGENLHLSFALHPAVKVIGKQDAASIRVGQAHLHLTLRKICQSGFDRRRVFAFQMTHLPIVGSGQLI